MSRRTTARAAPALLTGLLLVGCGDATSVARPADAEAGDELAAHGGEPCPDSLPLSDPADYGFGTRESAAEAPTLPRADEAWVCEYAVTDVAQPGSNGAFYRWDRTGDAVPVDRDELSNLDDLVAGLAPADAERGCNDDLGPRWLLVRSAAGDLTGIAVDDFGCREVRLTDEPYDVVPGEGAVPGVLVGPDALIERLRAIAGR